MIKTNRRAHFEYQILEKYEAGIVLSGAEAKAVRDGHIDISRAFVRFLNDELYLINANIHLKDQKNQATRSRKLLLHKSEMLNLAGKLSQKKLTIVPVNIYTKGRLVKLEIALASSKKEFQKKEKVKLRDIARDIERELRGEKIKYQKSLGDD